MFEYNCSEQSGLPMVGKIGFDFPSSRMNWLLRSMIISVLHLPQLGPGYCRGTQTERLLEVTYYPFPRHSKILVSVLGEQAEVGFSFC